MKIAAAALLELASDPARAAEMGRAGRARALERFPEDRCTERTEEVYRHWLEARGNGLHERRPSALSAAFTNGSR